jgi:molybdopterin-binding protein
MAFGLKKGDEAWAVIKASDVMVGKSSKYFATAL